MTELHLIVKNRVPVQRVTYSTGDLILDNSDIKVKVDFDEEWAGHTIMALCVLGDGTTFEPILVDSDNTFIIPVISGTASRKLSIGFTCGDVVTTRPVDIRIRPSIRTEYGEENMPVPTGEVFNAIMSRLDELSVEHSEVEASAAETLAKAEETIQAAQDYIDSVASIDILPIPPEFIDDIIIGR